MQQQRFETIGPLGTYVVVSVVTDDVDLAESLNGSALEEIERLEALLSIFRQDSAFSRWRAGATNELPSECVAVMQVGEQWRLRSDGAFNPRAGESVRHLADGRSANEATRLVGPAYRIVGDRVERLASCSGLDLNAVAKGWIVDRALEVAQADPAAPPICISAGGDLRWSGPGTWPVGVENPLRPYDNEPPLTSIDLPAGAIATSGLARRTLGPEGVSHLIDPRSGEPSTEIASVSVIADSAAAADAAATAAAVMDRAEALEWLAAVDEIVGALVVSPDGEATATDLWNERLGPIS